MTLVIELSTSDETRLAAVAQRMGIHPAEYVQKLLSEYLPAVDLDPGCGDNSPHEGSAYDEFRDLIGTVDDLPADLSSNPEAYMEGFGQVHSLRNLTQ